MQPAFELGIYGSGSGEQPASRFRLASRFLRMEHLLFGVLRQMRLEHGQVVDQKAVELVERGAEAGGPSMFRRQSRRTTEHELANPLRVRDCEFRRHPP